jgi:AraC-like DNA-binding protein
MYRSVRVEGRRIAATRAVSVVIRTVLQGSEQLAWNGHQVRVDVDSYLAVNGEDPVVLSRRSSADSRPLILRYSAPEVASALNRHRCSALGESMRLPATFMFTECLRSIDDPTGRGLHAAGARAGMASDEERHDILMHAVATELEFRLRTQHIATAKPATRDALVGKVLDAGDFILSNHEQPLSIAEVARVAGLSAYYFSRLFAQVYGVPPHAFLLEKRSLVARRLLAANPVRADVAAEVGYRSRASFYRMLKKEVPSQG